MSNTLKTSQEWVDSIPKEYNLRVYDPDGWDRLNYDYSFNEEKITKEEFKKRLNLSTIISILEFHEFIKTF